MWGCLAVAGLAVMVWLLMWWLDPSLRRRREFQAELATREPLPDAEMVTRYFADDVGTAEVSAEVRRVFARHMEYPAEKLLPDDDLLFFWAELDMAEFVEELQSGYGISISPLESELTPCTIRAVSALVASKTRRTTLLASEAE